MSVAWGSGGNSMKQAGWILLAGGAALEIAEIMAKSQTNSAQGNATFDQTALGKLVAPIEQVLPLSLGWSLIAMGAIIVWVIPYIGGSRA